MHQLGNLFRRDQAHKDEPVFEAELTFPVVNDLDNALNDAYDVRSLPTLVVIDKAGVVRYRNVGFEENIAEILEAQIESLR